MRKNPGSPLEALMDPEAAQRAREKGLKKPKKRRLARVCPSQSPDSLVASFFDVTTNSW